MTKEFLRRVPCTRERTPVVVPSWLDHYAEGWRAQGAASVILFGSRAHGLALSSSDWDVGVVFKDQDELPRYDAVEPSREVMLQNEVNPMLKSLNEIEPALLRELKAGISLIGDFSNLCDQFYRRDALATDRNEFIRHFMFGYVNAYRCIDVIGFGWEREEGNFELYDLHLHEGERYSADAAERAVKALCCALRVSYKFTHNIENLAESVPDEWREIVLRMNGSTKEKHESGYGGTFYESCEESLNRIEHTLELMGLIIDLNLFVLDDNESSELLENFEKEVGSSRLYHIEKPHKNPYCFKLFERAEQQIRSFKKRR